MTRSRAGAWLASRSPAPPAALARRLEAALGSCPDSQVSAARSMSDLMAALGLAMLALLDGRHEKGRDLALDLLAADALVTYAFEAAAEEGTPVDELVRRLLAEAGP